MDAHRRRTLLKGVISGVVLSVEVDQMKNNIPGGTRHLVRRRPVGIDEIENTVFC